MTGKIQTMSLARKRPFLVAILLILCVPVTLCTAFVIWYLVEIHRFANGSGPVADVSVAEVGGVKLELERRYAHPFLAEYLRTLTVTDRNGGTKRHDLAMDTGGSAKLTLCGTASGDIVLMDRIFGYQLSADGQLTSLPSLPACTNRLGAFDQTGDKSYGFIPG